MRVQPWLYRMEPHMQDKLTDERNPQEALEFHSDRFRKWEPKAKYGQ